MAGLQLKKGIMQMIYCESDGVFKCWVICQTWLCSEANHGCSQHLVGHLTVSKREAQGAAFYLQALFTSFPLFYFSSACSEHSGRQKFAWSLKHFTPATWKKTTLINGVNNSNHLATMQQSAGKLLVLALKANNAEYPMQDNEIPFRNGFAGHDNEPMGWFLNSPNLNPFEYLWNVTEGHGPHLKGSPQAPQDTLSCPLSWQVRVIFGCMKIANII